jgi:hypothetical protein
VSDFATLVLVVSLTVNGAALFGWIGNTYGWDMTDDAE